MQKSSGLTQYSTYYSSPYKIASIHRTTTADSSQVCFLFSFFFNNKAARKFENLNIN
jgi:hypothetical protein